MIADLYNMGATANDIASLERCRGFGQITPGLHKYTDVALGSMMGGKIVAKRLRATLGTGASFTFYGDGNGRPETLLASSCSDIEENGNNNAQAICETSVAIFDAYLAWLSMSIRLTGSR